MRDTTLQAQATTEKAPQTAPPLSTATAAPPPVVLDVGLQPEIKLGFGIAKGLEGLSFGLAD